MAAGAAGFLGFCGAATSVAVLGLVGMDRALVCRDSYRTRHPRAVRVHRAGVDGALAQESQHHRMRWEETAGRTERSVPPPPGMRAEVRHGESGVWWEIQKNSCWHLDGCGLEANFIQSSRRLWYEQHGCWCCDGVAGAKVCDGCRPQHVTCQAQERMFNV